MSRSLQYISHNYIKQRSWGRTNSFWGGRPHVRQLIIISGSNSGKNVAGKKQQFDHPRISLVHSNKNEVERIDHTPEKTLSQLKEKERERIIEPHSYSVSIPEPLISQFSWLPAARVADMAEAQLVAGVELLTTPNNGSYAYRFGMKPKNVTAICIPQPHTNAGGLYLYRNPLRATTPLYLFQLAFASLLTSGCNFILKPFSQVTIVGQIMVIKLLLPFVYPFL